jgi:hypothetical protein
MAADRPDAFILYKEQEDSVLPVVQELERRGVSTYFWRRDIEPGESWEDIEAAKLAEARAVVVFLGDQGWGPNHLKLAEQARGLRKRLIPVLIGNPPDEAFANAGELFRRSRYVDLRQPSEAAMELLVRAIRWVETDSGQAPLVDGIVATIRDGNESQRASVLEQIRLSKAIDRVALSRRLRSEIRERFNPHAESDAATAPRAPGKIGSIRSWLLSCLIQTDAEDAENRKLILEHLSAEAEPDHTVRFWVLAQLYTCRASYATDAAKQVSLDEAAEVNALARAILSKREEGLVDRLRISLASSESDTVCAVLRALRIVPIPELAGDVCTLIDRSTAGRPLAPSAPYYDALYALSNPEMAAVAAPILAQRPGIEPTVRMVLGETRLSDPNATRNLVSLLAAFPAAEVDRALADATGDPDLRATAELARGFLRELRQRGRGGEVLVAGYASDTVDVSDDRLDIREDVHTLAAVTMSKEVKPPLAIGLFGDWGSGKSFFMQSIRKVTEKMAAEAAKSQESKFCSSIVSIEFNAWHYADTNLWASMVSHILEQLAAHVAPQPTVEERQAALVSQLGSAKVMVKEAEDEKKRIQEEITSRAADLQKAQMERAQKEVRLRDLRATDFRSLIDNNKALKEKLDSTLEKMGVPAVLDSASDLERAIAEANTLRGRAAALFVSVVQSKNGRVQVTLLFFVLLVIPGVAYVLCRHTTNDFAVRIGAIAAQVVAVIAGAKNALGKALNQVKTSLGSIEEAKREVDRMLAAKRAQPGGDEETLQKEIAALKAQEQESESRLSAATARVAELEERIKSVKQGRSLAQFLAERTRSDDYRKHLGLISTVRQDFDALSKRLTAGSTDGDGFRRVDRIILYVDDLDRCPEERVIEVLQAVHLLLAYPLFVVVVGVDPRWLLHSLRGTFRAFRGGQKRLTPGSDSWQTTPQNYLEKIFQIPFSLRPMSLDGYSRLIDSLLLPRAVDREPITTGEGAASFRSAREEQPKEAAGDGGPSPLPLAAEESAKPVPQPEIVKPEFVIQEESLTIRTWEAAFADRLFGLIPTPRAAKRFSNVYRILKAPVQMGRLPAFEGTAELPGEFQVPMLLLAILIGMPAEALEAFPRLWVLALAKRDPVGALQGPAGDPRPSAALLRLQEMIRPIVSDPGFPRAPELYSEWIPRVSRFSFDVGRAVESMRQGSALEGSRTPE